MTSSSFTVTTNDLAAVASNVARRYGAIFTDIHITRTGGGSAAISVTWPDDVDDPGDPGPDPAVATLAAAVSAVTGHLVTEQARTSTLFAERIDLTTARDNLTKEREALATEKATVVAQFEAKASEAATLEQRLVAKQKELDDLKAAKAVKP